MDSDDYSKIESAVRVCLDECRASERPYVCVSTFLDQMRGRWLGSRHILELQTRVVRELLEQQYRDE